MKNRRLKINFWGKFCKDYGFDSRKKADIEVDAYDLPWLEGQKEREEQDDRTDSFFDSMD